MFYPNFILKEQIEYNVSSAQVRASPGRFLTCLGQYGYIGRKCFHIEKMKQEISKNKNRLQTCKLALLFFSSQATKVTFLEEGLQIHGMYGEVYAWNSIEDVILMEELPTIVMRTNGSALGSNLKGYFGQKSMARSSR